MSPSNEPSSHRATRASSSAGVSRERSPDRQPAIPAALLLVLAVLVCAQGCGGDDQASLRQDVRLDLSHDPPGSAPAGQPFLLGLRVSAEPPLPPESAHLWWSADGEWVRQALGALAGTERMEAEVPAQPRGRVVRYYFTVLSPLGETLRLPEESPPPASAPTAYELVVRAPAAAWTTSLGIGGALLAIAAVLLGAWTARSRSEPSGGARRALLLVPLGTVAFALAALGGVTVASVQATGSPLRDVPVAWWVALATWAAAAIAATALRGRGGAGAAGTRALAVLVIVLAVAGALCALAGLLTFV